MKESKVSTYILYALGEIVLVVVGILIALQIDSAHQDSQTRKLEIKYLKELRSNLEFDLNDLEFNVQFNRRSFRSTKIILEQLRNRQSYNDSLEFHFANIVFSTITSPNSSAYEGLRSKGLEIISSDSLRKQVTELYTFSYTYVREFERVDDHAHQFNVVWPELIKKVEIDSLSRSARPLDYKALQEDVPFKNMLASNLTFRGHMVGRYRGLKRSVSKLIEHIDYELDKLD